MRFTLLFIVEPAAYFGLPEQGKLVIPAVAGSDTYSPSVDSKSGLVVGHGTLPQFRRDEDRISLSIEIAGCHFQINDNYVRFSIDADSEETALRRGTTLFEDFLRRLTALQGDLFQSELLQIESEIGGISVRPGPREIRLLNVTAYNLETFSENLQKAASRSHIKDERFEKSILYYEHARLLFTLRNHIDSLSSHYSFLIASVYLQLWKKVCQS